MILGADLRDRVVNTRFFESKRERRNEVEEIQHIEYDENNGDGARHTRPFATHYLGDKQPHEAHKKREDGKTGEAAHDKHGRTYGAEHNGQEKDEERKKYEEVQTHLERKSHVETREELIPDEKRGDGKHEYPACRNPSRAAVERQVPAEETAETELHDDRNERSDRHHPPPPYAPRLDEIDEKDTYGRDCQI